jgi:branched-chain amino acid transport system ATP-binding protein
VSLLALDGVCIDYGPIRAVRDVSLTVEQGEVVTLIGANGAGKTSLLRAISGLKRPSGGKVTLAGRDVTGFSPDHLVRLGLAHAPEGRQVLTRQTVEDNLELGAFSRKDRPGIAEDLEAMYVLFPRLRERRGQLAGTLSGGEQQMLAIARALMSRPRLLLLDEPSLGLAPLLVEDIFEIITDLNRRGTTILLVEQNAGLALARSHRAYVLEAGQMAVSGPSAELAQDERVKRAYLG